ncbi:MAG: Hsp20/alpha crystallin family protein [Halobacteriota archaeon]
MGAEKHEEDDNVQQRVEERGAFPDPCRTLGEVRSSMGDILSRIRWPMWWPWAPLEPSAEEPAADIVDMGAELKVIIDLPGTAKKDIQISATRDSIEIAAVKAVDPTQRQVKYISRERGCASFKRVLALSEEIIPDETEASFDDGILTITLKKKQTEPARERVKVVVK